VPPAVRPGDAPRLLAPLVRLVVLNYNGGAMVQRCVEHLEALDWPADRLEIVVVDNASIDGSPAALAARERVRLVASPSNTGFPANNLGLRDLDDVDYVGLVNNDAFAEPDYLQGLVAALEADPGLGAACPKIVLADRFLELTIDTPTTRVPGDPRDLGVRVSGVEVGGADSWKGTGFADGFGHEEAGDRDEGHFRWTAGHAVLRAPVGRPGEPVPPSARLRLAALRPVEVVLDGGAGGAPVEVDTTPSWFDVPLAGAPFDVVNNVGSELVAGGWGRDRGFLQPDRGQFDETQEVFAWCGAGVLFRADHLRDIGLFDERFFMYYEDVDLAWRGRSRGWRFAYVPTSRLRHVHAATSVEGSDMFQHFVERNRLVLLAKNAPRELALSAPLAFLRSTASYARRDVLRPLLRGRRPQLGLVKRRLRSFGAFLALLPHALDERRRIRRRQRVHDDALMGWAVKVGG
jgi:GT2 family glycosyltransferase